MSANRIKAFLERLMYNPLQDRVKEAIELKEKYDSIQNQIEMYKKITLDELVGFPIPQEHRENLMEKWSAYKSMTHQELIALLLQNDWEVLQMKKVMEE